MESRCNVSSDIYPFTAVAGQAAFKLALLLAAVNPLVGGVLIQGPRGVAKSTLAKGLIDILPNAPLSERSLGQQAAQPLQARPPFVPLPLGASEDALVGTLNLQQVLNDQTIAFQPGLLAKAHRGILYVDEVNLLPDNLVDQLLDVCASGVNTVERDGVSHQHDAQFILLGTMNPEEGDLRPQLLDRFGLCVMLDNAYSLEERTQIVSQRELYDANPRAFCEQYKEDQQALQQQIQDARTTLPTVACSHDIRLLIAERCQQAHVDGLRADIVWVQASKASAALAKRHYVIKEDVTAVEDFVLSHRWNTSPDVPPPNQPPPHSPTPQGPSSSGFSRPDNSRQPLGDGNQAEGHSAQGDWGAMPPSSQALPATTTLESDAAVKTLVKTLVKTVQLSSEYSNQSSQFKQSIFAQGNQAAKKQKGMTIGRFTAAHRKRNSNKVDWFKTLLDQGGRLPLKRVQFKPPAQGQVTVHLVLLDTSSSVLSGRAFAQAKALILQLAHAAYLNREQFALVGFGGQKASLLLGSRKSHQSLHAFFDGLQAGGGTPLTEAIDCALAYQHQRSRQYSNALFYNYIFTDGRIQQPLPSFIAPSIATPSKLAATSMKKMLQGKSVVVDIERSQVKRGKSQQIATALKAQYYALSA